MKTTLTLSSMLAAALLLSACGGGSGTSDTGSASAIEGKLIDSPVHGATYRCGTISHLTGRDGSFACDVFPVTFYTGNVKIGEINQLPADGYVTPQDLIGVARSDYNDTVAGLALFLQSLDDDGDIEQRITLDTALMEELKDRHLDITTMTETEIINLLSEIGADAVDKDGALAHLHTHVTEITSTPASTENGESTASEDTTETPSRTGDTTEVDADAFKQAYLDLINEARAEGRECGSYGYFPAADPLTWNDALYHAAYEHSRDMAISNTFSHTGSGTQSDATAVAEHAGTGSSVGERIEHNGYTDWHRYGENIAAGTSMDEAIEAMEGWLASPGHCKNIMKAEFKEVGMAVYYDADSHYRYYWTQDFGTK